MQYWFDVNFAPTRSKSADSQRSASSFLILTAWFLESSFIFFLYISNFIIPQSDKFFYFSIRFLNLYYKFLLSSTEKQYYTFLFCIHITVILNGSHSQFIVSHTMDQQKGRPLPSKALLCFKNFLFPLYSKENDCVLFVSWTKQTAVFSFAWEK